MYTTAPGQSQINNDPSSPTGVQDQHAIALGIVDYLEACDPDALAMQYMALVALSHIFHEPQRSVSIEAPAADIPKNNNFQEIRNHATELVTGLISDERQKEKIFVSQSKSSNGIGLLYLEVKDESGGFIGGVQIHATVDPDTGTVVVRDMNLFLKDKFFNLLTGKCKTMLTRYPHSVEECVMVRDFMDLAFMQYAVIESSSHVSDSSIDVDQILKISLDEEFYELLDGVKLAGCAVAKSDKIRDLEKFRFIPLTCNHKQGPSLHEEGRAKGIEQGVRLTYPEVISGAPYLDTTYAIGLVYDEHLIAVAGACVDDNGVLVITQIQDVTGVRKISVKTTDQKVKKEVREANKPFYNTGLHNGLDWRQTLIRAWEEIALKMGATTVSVQSAHNNRWENVAGNLNSKYGYDVPAEALGYTFDETSGNFVKTI